MKIEQISVDKIKPYERNAKKHPPEQVEHIANSIKEFGWQQPIVLDKENVVIIGHGRLQAAKMLGVDKVPCLRAETLTEPQIKALRLADNKTNESEWDFELLDSELVDLALDFDMADFGFVDNALPPIPEILDADTDYDEEAPLAIKLTFPNFTAYSMYEGELKNVAERMGAQFAIVKT